MNDFEQKLFNALLEKKLISEEKAEEISEELRGREDALEYELVSAANVSSQDILKAKEEMGELPGFSLRDERQISQDLLREIPEEAARQYKIVPLEKKGNTLKVGVVNPENYAAREAIRFITFGSRVDTEVYVITEETFRKVLRKYGTLRGVIKEALSELEKELKKPEEAPEAPPEISEVLKEAPITKVVAVVVKHAVEGRASDIHIESGERRTRVRFRVDGKLYTSIFLPSSIHASILSRIKILASLRIDESRVPQDGRFSADISGRTIAFRVSTFPTRLGEKAVLRVLDPSLAIQNFEDLGLVGLNMEKMKKALKRPFGMILLSGPTGSGKSTTLYAALMSLDREALNVVSLEDPVEYFIDGVNQSQVRPEIDYSFASGLRNVLRQDPDIIMVGEIRDSETATLATHASLTGHLVFSTIHTNNAVGVIPRLIDMGVASYLLPSSMTLAAAQRLVRKLCPHCKVSGSAPSKLATIIKDEIASMPEDAKSYFKLKVKDNYELWHSPGCEKCGGRGVMGRLGIFEVILMTRELKETIYRDPTEDKIKQEAQRQGMVTLFQDGMIKALQGIISMEEVIRVTVL